MTLVVSWPYSEDTLAGSARLGEHSVWRLQVRGVGPRPSMEELARSRERGLVGIEVVDPIDLDVDEHVEALALVRDAAALGIAIDWAFHESVDKDVVRSLAHLPPPARGTPGLLGDWAALHRRNSYYWRLGPGFVKVFDGRVREDARRFTIGDPNLVEAFVQLHDHGWVEPGMSRACEFLCAQGLALRIATRMFIPICRLAA